MAENENKGTVTPGTETPGTETGTEAAEKLAADTTDAATIAAKAAADALAGKETKGEPEKGEETPGLENEHKTVLTAEKGEADKLKDAEDGDKGKTETPGEYTAFDMPEGMEVNPEQLSAFVPVAKELKLTQEQAQKLVDVQADLVAKEIQAQQTAWAETQQTWRNEVRADSEVGGDKMAEKVALGKKALDVVGTPALGALLDATGTGNHVEFIRFFARVGEFIGDDVLNFGGTFGKDQPVDPAKILFPNQK